MSLLAVAGAGLGRGCPYSLRDFEVNPRLPLPALSHSCNFLCFERLPDVVMSLHVGAGAGLGSGLPGRRAVDALPAQSAGL
jgi:hypothetical protein